MPPVHKELRRRPMRRRRGWPSLLKSWARWRPSLLAEIFRSCLNPFENGASDSTRVSHLARLDVFLPILLSNRADHRPFLLRPAADRLMVLFARPFVIQVVRHRLVPFLHLNCRRAFGRLA